MDMQVVGAADDLAAPLARRDRAQHAATIRGSSDMAHPTSIDGLQYRAGIDARSRQLTSDPPPVEDEDSFVLCRAMATSSMCQGQPKCAATIVRAGWAAATASSRLPGGSRTTAQIAAAPAYPLQTNLALLQRIANLMEQFGMTQQDFNAGSMVR